MNQLKVAIKNCRYTKDRSPDGEPEMLVDVTKKMGYLRDLQNNKHRVSLRRLCRDYSVVPYQSEFQDFDFAKPVDILKASGAIHLAEHLYGYSERDSLLKFLEAAVRFDNQPER